MLERKIEESTFRFLRYLSFDNVKEGKAFEFAREDYKDISKKRRVKENIPLAWEKLLEEKDEILIDVISDKVESICGYKASETQIIQYLSSLVEKAVDFRDYKLDSSQKNRSFKKKNITIEPTRKNQIIKDYKVHDAHARIKIIGNDCFIILKGSTAIIEDKNSMPNNAKKFKIKLIQDGILVRNSKENLYKFTEDCSCSSASLATNIVSGTMTNGKKCLNIGATNNT